jgi:hypothetical protein
MSEYFEEIIFPSIKKEMRMENISDEFYNEMRYWFQFCEDETLFMVECPVCGETYCYSKIPAESQIIGLCSGIEDNAHFFQKEWEENCPEQKNHQNIISVLNYYKEMSSVSKETRRLAFEWDE